MLVFGFGSRHQLYHSQSSACFCEVCAHVLLLSGACTEVSSVLLCSPAAEDIRASHFAITALGSCSIRDIARVRGLTATLLRGLSTSPAGTSRKPSLPWVARRPASAVPSLPRDGKSPYYDPSEAPHHYVWSSKMSRARVYPDVNVKRPRSYWDYENMTITWG